MLIWADLPDQAVLFRSGSIESPNERTTNHVDGKMAGRRVIRRVLTFIFHKVNEQDMLIPKQVTQVLDFRKGLKIAQSLGWRSTISKITHGTLYLI